ncbi:MAG: cation transporter [Planctomycetes bacterium]|nr:cation transporter [Planctomycetota bacterium]
MPALCPVAGKPGRRVPEVTLRSLIRSDRLSEVEGREWFYCDLPDCDVVYFASDGRTVLKNDIQVRVGAKEKTSPRMVCYCFGHTAESIREEIERTSQSSVAASIAAKVKAGECSCETMNPKGTCCLGDVNKVVKDAFVSLGGNQPGLAPNLLGRDRGGHDCCAARREDAPAAGKSPRVERAGLLAAGASVVSAIMASACCCLPLLLVAFGASAAGASAAFERVRPFFLALAPLFLGLGFYMAYFRKEACAPGSACAVPNRKLKRFNRAMLWVATAVVAAVAFFPNYVGLLLRREPVAAAETGGPTETVTLRIDGMTCESCAVHVESELASVPGVRRASVIYSEGRVIVTVDATHPPDAASLVSAVGKAGYRAHIGEDK